MTTQEPPSSYNPRLHALCIAFVLCTFPLLISGGSVTSHGAGMSVYDWPTSFGHNMFFLPFDKWIGPDHGQVFLEHSHRLFASVIGLICIAVTATVWTTRSERPWVRKLAALLLVLVIFQGVMGGLRVTEISYVLAILHGIHAQIFFCLTVLLAAATSRTWHDLADRSSSRILTGQDATTLRRLSVALLLVMLLQLTLGALVRHTQSALAIPDFPTSYGSLLPPMTPQAVKLAQESRNLSQDHLFSDFSVAQVHLAFAHRVGACLVLIAAALLLARLIKLFPDEPAVRRPMFAYLALLALQITLGALVIWTGHQPEVATAHQAIGAALIATATLLTIRVFLFTQPLTIANPAGKPNQNPVPPTAQTDTMVNSEPSAVSSSATTADGFAR